jgi:excinuclease UvrABC ATPase subunit
VILVNWAIYLVPDGGKVGAQVVAAATPGGVVCLSTNTGKALETVLAR